MSELEKLRDIHSPPPIPFWPPALGWWILMVLVLLCIVGGWFFYQWKKKQALRKAALDELNQLQQSLEKNHDFPLFSAQISTLLRRLSLIKFNRSEVAGLTGKAWLEFLDRTGQTNNFSQGDGKAIATAPYQPITDIDAQELIAKKIIVVVKNWINLNT